MPRFEIIYALREMFHLRKVFFLLLLNLTLGMVSYLTLSTFRHGLREVLLSKAKETLSADLSISVRRSLTDEEVSEMTAMVVEKQKTSRLFDFMSMVVARPAETVGKEESRLVQVKAIDAQYPLYGYLVLKSGKRITGESIKEIVSEPVVWVYPEVLVQLGLQIGDRVQLGGHDFRIADTIVEDSTQTFSFGALAPKIYIGQQSLAQTGLMKFGTTLSDSLLFQTSDLGKPLKELKQDLMGRIKDPAVQIITYQDANEQTSRFLTQLFDYLGLGALVGVSLSAFGLVALVQSWLQQKIRGYAIASALGLSAFQIQRIFLFQLFLVAISTLLISFLLVAIGLPFLSVYISQWITVPFDASLRASAVIQGSVLVIMGSLALSLPFLRSLAKIPTQRLFSEAGSLNLELSWSSTLRWAPALIGYWILSVYEVSSYRLGSIFFFSVIGVYLVLALLGWALFKMLPQLIEKLNTQWSTRHGLLYLQRKSVLLITFISLSLGTFLTVLVPQVRAGLKSELNPSTEMDQPSLFLFDIQDDQIDPLKNMFKDKGYELRHVSPLIRSRILTVNDQAYERAVLEDGFTTREAENEARFRNRGINLSFRPELASSETILEGEPFSREYDDSKPIELSVEKRYAERMNLKMGDVLRLDIQGVEITGRIHNFRQVKWSSFQPNFFILVHPKALPDAPKIWLADVQVPAKDRGNLQNLVAKQFPNVSAVDIVRLVEKLTEMTGQMTLALESMAWLTTISGLMVLLALLVRQLSLQRWDANLFRLLGASRSRLRGLFLVQFGSLVALSCISGALVAILVAQVMTWILFESAFQLDLPAVMISLGIILGLGFTLAIRFARNLAQANPARLLQEVRI